MKDSKPGECTCKQISSEGTIQLKDSCPLHGFDLMGNRLNTKYWEKFALACTEAGIRNPERLKEVVELIRHIVYPPNGDEPLILCGCCGVLWAGEETDHDEDCIQYLARKVLVALGIEEMK